MKKLLLHPTHPAKRVARGNGLLLMCASPILLVIAVGGAKQLWEVVLGIVAGAVWFFGGRAARRWGLRDDSQHFGERGT